MPTIFVKVQHSTQQGYSDTASGSLYTSTAATNYALTTSRVNMFRFAHVNVPKGATINSAILHTAYTVKNQTGTAYSHTQSVSIDSALGATTWLDTTRNEYAGRTWSAYGTTATFNWNQNIVNKQLVSHDVTAHLNAAVNGTNWTLAGGALTMMISYSAVTSPDNQYMHTMDDGWSPMLEINYTPLADSLGTVVNIQPNCNFERNTNSTGAADVAPYNFNPYFSTFTQPTYEIITTGIPAGLPVNTRALRVTAPSTGTPRTMVGFGGPKLTDGDWYNASAYVYVPAGMPDVGISVLGQTPNTSSTMTSLKNQWVRLDVSWISSENDNSNICVQQVNGGYAPSTVFWIANVQVTSGRLLRPYVDGRKTLTGATYGWAGPVGYNAFVRSAPPTTPTVTSAGDKARRVDFPISWTYSQTNGQVQAAAEIKVRRSG